MSARRFPGWVFPHGTEPDPRFTLADERTFLAWIRTALTLVAAGIALEAVPVPRAEDYRWSASFSLIMLGMLLPGVAWWSWAVTERALRRGEPLPSSRVAPLLAAGVVVVAGTLLVDAVTRWMTRALFDPGLQPENYLNSCNSPDRRRNPRAHRFGVPLGGSPCAPSS